MVPSFVVFFSCVLCCEGRLGVDGLASGGYGDGIDEAEVLAGAFRRPRGSLRLALDMRRTEPVDCQPVRVNLPLAEVGRTGNFVCLVVVQDAHGPLRGLRFDIPIALG